MSADSTGDALEENSLEEDAPEDDDRGAGERTTGWRGLTFAVLIGLAGSGLALYALTRTWAVEVIIRPAPLPDLRIPHDGPEELVGVAVTALAAIGAATVATRGVLRRVVGMFVLLIGCSLAAGGISGVAHSLGLWAGQRMAEHGWPAALCLVGGVAVGFAGWLTLRYGRYWPALGARYEPGRARTSGRSAARDGSAASVQAWDALDRGEDPTLR